MDFESPPRENLTRQISEADSSDLQSAFAAGERLKSSATAGFVNCEVPRQVELLTQLLSISQPANRLRHIRIMYWLNVMCAHQLLA